jgi:hypothetical protein
MGTSTRPIAELLSGKVTCGCRPGRTQQLLVRGETDDLVVVEQGTERRTALGEDEGAAACRLEEPGVDAVDLRRVQVIENGGGAAKHLRLAEACHVLAGVETLKRSGVGPPGETAPEQLERDAVIVETP